ncbi:MAG: 5-formyltetrahydrofolate cyclo-ligase [Henriciella sp.]
MPDLTKQTLRRELKARRLELQARAPDAGEDLADRFPLKLLERFGPYVSAYWPIGSELDPRPLMQRLHAQGATLCLPWSAPGQPMCFRQWRPDDQLETASFGLKQPLSTADRVTPRLILAPLLGVDTSGMRLGYGQGHYDRAVASIRETGPAFLCGLAFAGQLIETIPSEAHDIPLDWLVTEHGSTPFFLSRASAPDIS